MRASTVSRSSDSLSDLAARVSARCWRTWRSCSATVRQAVERGGAGVGERGGDLGVDRPSPASAVQEQDAVEPVGRAQQQQQPVARLAASASRGQLAASASRPTRSEPQAPVEQLGQERVVVEREVAPMQLRRPAEDRAAAGRASGSSSTAPLGAEALAGLADDRRVDVVGGALGRGGQQPDTAIRAPIASVPGWVSVLNRSPCTPLFTLPRRPGEVAEWLKALAC